MLAGGEAGGWLIEEGVLDGALEEPGASDVGGAGGEVVGEEVGDGGVAADGVGATEGVGVFVVGAGAWDGGGDEAGGEEVGDGDLVGDEDGADLGAWARAEVASTVRSMRVIKVEEAIVVRKQRSLYREQRESES